MAIALDAQQPVEYRRSALQIRRGFEQRHDAKGTGHAGSLLQQVHGEYIGCLPCHRDHVGAERLWMDSGDGAKGVEDVLHGWRRLEPARQQWTRAVRSEEHTSELQSQSNLVCRLLLEKK